MKTSLKPPPPVLLLPHVSYGGRPWRWATKMPRTVTQNTKKKKSRRGYSNSVRLWYPIYLAYVLTLRWPFDKWPVVAYIPSPPPKASIIPVEGSGNTGQFPSGAWTPDQGASHRHRTYTQRCRFKTTKTNPNHLLLYVPCKKYNFPTFILYPTLFRYLLALPRMPWLKCKNHCQIS